MSALETFPITACPPLFIWTCSTLTNCERRGAGASTPPSVLRKPRRLPTQITRSGAHHRRLQTSQEYSCSGDMGAGDLDGQRAFDLVPRCDRLDKRQRAVYRRFGNAASRQLRPGLGACGWVPAAIVVAAFVIAKPQAFTRLRSHRRSSRASILRNLTMANFGTAGGIPKGIADVRRYDTWFIKEYFWPLFRPTRHPTSIAPRASRDNLRFGSFRSGGQLWEFVRIAHFDHTRYEQIRRGPI